MTISWLSILIGSVLGVIMGRIIYKIFFTQDDDGDIIVVNLSTLENENTNVSTKRIVFYK